MKKAIVSKIVLLTSLFALVGCADFLWPSSTSSESSLTSSEINSGSSSEKPLPSEPIIYDGYYKPTSHMYNNRELTESGGFVPFSSLGQQKLLVVPVVFTDTKSKNLATSANKTALEKTFFGTSSETGWESVSSYYAKSSYGRLQITGEVADYFNLGITASSLNKKTTYNDPTYYVLEKLYKEYSASKLSEYDTDGDGHVDALWLVYMYPYNTTDPNSIYWAYQYYYNAYPNTAKPTFGVYAWASYEFMSEGDGYSLSKPDAHTFIHETGHVMSLYDYYDYSEKSAPAGAIDMMDYNIIDHNAYSKFVYNWVEPYVVTDSATINLRSTTETGDFILINDNWNGHPYDEYIIIEFYTPTGLNAKDVTPYYEGMPAAFSVPGVRMYHIDSRLMKAKLDGTGVGEFVDEIISTNTHYTDIGISNSQDEWHMEGNYNHKHVHLLNAAGSETTQDWYYKNTPATNSALFQTGDKINANNWKKYLKYSNTFNDGTAIGYSVEIGAMTNNEVSIIITKK